MRQKPKDEKPILMPFRLIRYTPAFETQVLMTTRKEKHMRMEASKKRKSESNNRSDFIRSNNVTPSMETTKATEQLLSTFRSSLKDLDAALVPTFDENIQRLQSMTHRQSTTVSLPKLKKPLTSNGKQLMSQRSIITAMSIPGISNIDPIPGGYDNDECKELKIYKKNFDRFLGFWTIKPTIGEKLNSREGCQGVIVENKLYVYGGQSWTKHTDIRQLTIPTWTWRQITASYSPQGRLGHSLVAYKKKLIVYGGWGSHRENLGPRRCASKVYYLSLSKLKWQRYSGSGPQPNPRMHHCAAQLGKHMIVYGGIDIQNIASEDLFLFDIKSKEWSLPEVTVAQDPGPRSHATLTAVFHEDLKNIFDFSIFNIPLLKQDYIIPNSGFYLFGGLDRGGMPCNSLFGLYVQVNKIIWTEVNGYGKPPPPRYAHTACSINNLLFIFGGRDDFSHKAGEDMSLNDLHVFNVETLMWLKVDMMGTAPAGRWGHCMVSIASKVLIFGGMTLSKFLSSDIYCLETNTEAIEELIRENKRNFKQERVEVKEKTVVGRELKGFISRMSSIEEEA